MRAEMWPTDAWVSWRPAETGYYQITFHERDVETVHASVVLNVSIDQLGVVAMAIDKALAEIGELEVDEAFERSARDANEEVPF